MKSLEESIMDNIVAAVTSLMFSEDDAIHSEVKRNLVRAALRSGGISESYFNLKFEQLKCN